MEVTLGKESAAICLYKQVGATVLTVLVLLHVQVLVLLLVELLVLLPVLLLDELLVLLLVSLQEQLYVVVTFDVTTLLQSEI